MRLIHRPLSTFPAVETPDWERRPSPFNSSWSQTTELLQKELDFLGADDVFLECDVRESDIRLDGTLRVRAVMATPRIVLSFDSKHGPLRYGCDRFTKWQDNLRAIALGLEALRKVERYGIAKRGEQYQGYKSLGSGIVMSSGAMTPEKAAQVILDAAGVVYDDSEVRSIIRSSENRKSRYRQAVQNSHPDAAGGSEDAFKRVQEAKDLLDAQ